MRVCAPRMYTYTCVCISRERGEGGETGIRKAIGKREDELVKWTTRVAHVGERGTGQRERARGEMSVMRTGSCSPPPSTLFLYKIKYRNVPGSRVSISGLNTRLIIINKAGTTGLHAFLH